jgi:hypothetical protein
MKAQYENTMSGEAFECEKNLVKMRNRLWKGQVIEKREEIIFQKCPFHPLQNAILNI